MRIGRNQCSLCPDPILNSLRIVGVLALTLCFILMLIFFNIRKQKESEVSITGKILTNYFHMVSTSLSFNIAFPKQFYQLFSPVQTMASSSDTILSFDCFIEDVKIGIIQQSEYLSKTLISCLLPLGVYLIFILIFGLLKLIRKQSNFLRNIVISFITILYFFYPTLTEKVIGLFHCTTIENSSRFTDDLELECWKGIHLNFATFLGIPMIIIWVLGIPILGITFLVINRKKILSSDFKKYFLILY